MFKQFSFTHTCKVNENNIKLGNFTVKPYINKNPVTGYIGNKRLNLTLDEQHSLNLNFNFSKIGAGDYKGVSDSSFLVFKRSTYSNQSSASDQGFSIKGSVSGAKISDLIFAENSIVIVASNEMFDAFNISCSDGKTPIISNPTINNEAFVTCPDGSINVTPNGHTNGTVNVGTFTLTLTGSGDPSVVNNFNKSGHEWTLSNYVDNPIIVKFPQNSLNNNCNNVVKHNNEYVIHLLKPKISGSSSSSSNHYKTIRANVYGVFASSTTLTGTGSAGTKFQICIGEGPKSGGNYGYGASNNECFILFTNSISISNNETFSHSRISPNPFKITDKIVIN